MCNARTCIQKINVKLKMLIEQNLQNKALYDISYNTCIYTCTACMHAMDVFIHALYMWHCMYLHTYISMHCTLHSQTSWLP